MQVIFKKNHIFYIFDKNNRNFYLTLTKLPEIFGKAIFHSVF